MITRIVTNAGDPLVNGNGDPVIGARIRFYLVDESGKFTDGWDLISGERVVPGPVDVLTDDNGEFSVGLWPTSRGDKILYWLCRLDGLKDLDFIAPLIDGVGSIQWAAFKVGGSAPTPQQYRLWVQTTMGVATKAALDAVAGAYDEGECLLVTNDPTPANNGTWRKEGAVWVQSSFDRVAAAEAATLALSDGTKALVGGTATSVAGLITTGATVGATYVVTFNQNIYVAHGQGTFGRLFPTGGPYTITLPGAWYTAYVLPEDVSGGSPAPVASVVRYHNRLSTATPFPQNAMTLISCGYTVDELSGPVADLIRKTRVDRGLIANQVSAAGEGATTPLVTTLSLVDGLLTLTASRNIVISKATAKGGTSVGHYYARLFPLGGPYVLTVPTAAVCTVYVLSSAIANNYLTEADIYSVTGGAATELPPDAVVLLRTGYNNTGDKTPYGILADLHFKLQTEANTLRLNAQPDVTKLALSQQAVINLPSGITPVSMTLGAVGSDLTFTSNQNMILHLSGGSEYSRIFPDAGPFSLSVSGSWSTAYVTTEDVTDNAYLTGLVKYTILLGTALPANAIILLGRGRDGLGPYSGLLAEYYYNWRLTVLDQATIDAQLIAALKGSGIGYGDIHRKFPRFTSHWLKRDKNLNVLLVGDSMTARTGFAEQYPLAETQTRPPMSISKSMISLIHDKLTWGNCNYRRFDAPDVFTETGDTWESQLTVVSTYPTNANWDDSGDRAGDTRFQSGTDASSVAFSFPATMKICNFIYRTDLAGSSALAVSVADGAGRVEVKNGAGNWVEANGYEFSMLAPAANSGAGIGNTVFQARLYLRKASGLSANVDAITITKPASGAATRLLYWGIEYSLDDYIVTVVNSARGGHTTEQLASYISSEVDGREFDLVICQFPLANNLNTLGTPAEHWTRVFSFAFDEANTKSLYSKGKTATAWDTFEMITWLPYPTRAYYQAGGAKVVYANGYTAEDIHRYILGEILERGDVAVLSMFNLWLAPALTVYGDMYTALTGTSSAGASLLSDSIHANVVGHSLIEKFFLPLFDFSVG